MNQLPLNGVELAGLAIITIGSLTQLRIQQKVTNRRVSANADKIDEVHEQVRNDHPRLPNLRDDIDAISEMVREGLDNIRGDIRGVHKDISQLHGSIGGVRRELHEEIERLTRADRNLNQRLNNLHQPPGDSTR